MTDRGHGNDAERKRELATAWQRRRRARRKLGLRVVPVLVDELALRD